MSPSVVVVDIATPMTTAVAPAAVETFPAAEAVHGGQSLLRRDRRVDRLRRRKAQITDPAGLDPLLAEIAAHGGGATGDPVEHAVELAQLAVLDLTDLLADLAAGGAAQGPGHVGRAIEGDPLGRLAVAARAADLLPVGLDRGRRVGVDDEPDVRLVDAHAERDGRHHHGGIGLEELFQPFGAQVAVEAGVIGQGRDPYGGESLGQLVGAVA